MTHTITKKQAIDAVYTAAKRANAEVITLHVEGDHLMMQVCAQPSDIMPTPVAQSGQLYNYEHYDERDIVTMAYRLCLHWCNKTPYKMPKLALKLQCPSYLEGHCSYRGYMKLLLI